MGQSFSCGARQDHEIFSAVQCGDITTVRAVLAEEPGLLNQTTVFDRHSVLHIAAASGQIEILDMLLDQVANPDVLNRKKQTPLMLAAMYGKISCVRKLTEVGANILMFDSINRRTCLHYAAYYGHADCVQVILSVAQSSSVAVHWGYARFVNIRDDKGATPLHLAARQRRPQCVHVLLDSGALVCASTGVYVSPGSTPLHLAARSGSIDCVRKLLAWGAGRLQRDASGRIPYIVAMKHKHGACAALLNPSSAEPLVWPSPLKFISELNNEAKVLLEQALMEANRERERTILKGTAYSLPSPAPSDMSEESSREDLCCICFEQLCTIEVKDCGHQMCAQCILALCCHSNRNPATSDDVTPPVCPFCRSKIACLVVAPANKSKTQEDGIDTEITNLSPSKISNSFKVLSAVGSFGKINGCNSGRIASDDWVEKALPRNSIGAFTQI